MAYIETIHESDVTGELANLYKRVGNPDGTVDNVMKIHALNPLSLKAHFELYVQALHKHSPLSRAEREMVATEVSRLNGCEYCLHHHNLGLKRLLPEERHEAAEALFEGDWGGLTEREEALVNYARKLTLTPHDMDEDDSERRPRRPGDSRPRPVHRLFQLRQSPRHRPRGDARRRRGPDGAVAGGVMFSRDRQGARAWPHSDALAFATNALLDGRG
jgi:uncharacterized peroxidase-related enzyme